MSDYTRILCAVDASEASRRVLDYALWWARWHGADVSVVRINPLPPPGTESGAFSIDTSLTGMPESAAAPPAPDPGEREARLAELEAFIRESRLDGLQVEAVLEDNVSVGDAIVARASALAADLIVVGAGHDAAAGPNARVGPATEQVLRSSPCSVLVVPAPGASIPVPPTGTIRRILCAVDFSTASRDALASAVELAEAAPAHLSVVHVVELFSEVAALAYDFDQHREVRIQPACEQLDTLVAQIAGPVRPVEEIVADGDATVEILKLAHEDDTDLLVMPTPHQPGAPARAAAIVDAVTAAAQCPVLIVALEEGAIVATETEPEEVRARSGDAA